MINSESEIKILRLFCENSFSSFSVQEISKAACLSRNWVYRNIEKFKKDGLLMEKDKRYRLNFTNLFNQKMKIFFDYEFIFSIENELQERVLEIYEKIKFELKSFESLILVGSVSMLKQTKKSDVDFLLIEPKGEIPYFENCNIISLSKEEFEKKYLAGDDFVVSCLYYGKIIHDKGFYLEFLAKPLPVFTEESAQQKLSQIEKQKKRIYSLLEIDDIEQATKELRNLLNQKARLILIKNQIIPKSKQEIPGQIRKINPELAKLFAKAKFKKNEIIELLAKG